jgi:hypothetical protein
MTYQQPQWQPGQQPQYPQPAPYAQQPPPAPPSYAPQPYQQAPHHPGAAPYPQQPQVYTGPLPGGDPKAQAWKNYGMQWLLGLGFLGVIGIFALIYNLATGEW